MTDKIETEQATTSGLRFSLRRTFALAFTLILLLYIGLSLASYYRLVNFEHIIADISENELPNVITAGRLYGQVNTLAASAALLQKASSNASLRIARKELDRNIENIRKLSDAHLVNEFMDTQLNIIELELQDFSQLIARKISIKEQLYKAQRELYNLQKEVMSSTKVDITNVSLNRWHIELEELIGITGFALNQQRLSEVRQAFALVSQRLQSLEGLARSKALTNTYYRQFTERLSDLLNAQNGIPTLKIEQLKVNGRTIGRANFIHNLIIDYARSIEFGATKIDQAVLAEAKSITTDIRQQIQYTGITLSLSVLFIVLLLLILHKKVVLRLAMLNQLVARRLNGDDKAHKIKGNDEIRDIADTFDRFANTIEQQKQELEHLSRSDSLTGVANRRALDDVLVREMQVSIRQRWPVSVLLIDVDFFKSYNNNYGQGKGDQCLKWIAEVISNEIQRPSDFLARFGGEEFICVLPNTPEVGAVKIADQIKQALAERAIKHEFSEVADYVTVSIGIVTSSEKLFLAPDTIVHLADKALNRAKAHGRNGYVKSSKMDVAPK